MPEANLKELQLAAIELSSEISSEAQAVGRIERKIAEVGVSTSDNAVVDANGNTHPGSFTDREGGSGTQSTISELLTPITPEEQQQQAEAIVGITNGLRAAKKEREAEQYRIMHKDYPYEDERPIPIPVMAVPGFPEHLLVCRTSLIRMVAALNSDIARTLKMYNDGLEKITERVGNHLDKSLGELLIGDIVQRRDAHNMRSGASAYGGAVVISVDPYIMVSQSGDMRWSCEEAKNYFRVGIASDEQVAICMRRLEN